MNGWAFLYDANHHDQEVELTKGLIDSLSESQLLWVDCCNPTKEEIHTLASLLKLQKSILEAVPVKAVDFEVRTFESYFQFSVTTLKIDQQGALHPVAVNFVCGRRFILTLHSQEAGFLEAFKNQDQGDTQIGSLPSAMAVSAMLDWLLSGYFRVIESLEVDIDCLDEQTLAYSKSNPHFLRRLGGIRQRISQVRRILYPQREVFHGLSRPDFSLPQGNNTSAYFQFLSKRFERVVDHIESAQNQLQGSFEMFSLRTAESTNTFMRTLAFLTLIFGVMNVVGALVALFFEASSATKFNVFWSTVTGMLLMTLSAILYARLKKWI